MSYCSFVYLAAVYLGGLGASRRLAVSLVPTAPVF